MRVRSEPNKLVRQNLISARWNKNMTQRDVSKIVGVHQTLIAQIERGECRATEHVAKALEELFFLEKDDLFILKPAIDPIKGFMKNKYEIRGDITAIFIRCKGKVYETIIDTKDLSKAGSFSGTWFGRYSKNTKTIYVAGKYKQKVIWLHRVLLDASLDMFVDHVNGDTLDNRTSENIREATVAQNNQNTKSETDRRSKYRGVSFRSAEGKWVAAVKVKGKLLYYKTFTDVEEAKTAVMEARAVHLPFSREALTIKVEHPEEYIMNKDKSMVTNKSGVKHVCYSERERKWKATVKKKHLGTFKTKEEAAEAVRLFKESMLKEQRVS